MYIKAKVRVVQRPDKWLEYLQQRTPAPRQMQDSSAAPAVLREIAGVDPGRVRAAQHRRDAHRTRQLLREVRPRPGRPRTGISILAVLHMVRVRLVGVPDVPARRVDDIAETGVLEHDARVVAPRTAEVVGSCGDGLARCCGDGGLIDDIVGRVGGRVAAVGRDVVAAVYDADVDAVEPGGGLLAEDEVCCALDVALGVDLGAVVRKESVLETCTAS
jgi:hypothetical protein